MRESGFLDVIRFEDTLLNLLRQEAKTTAPKNWERAIAHNKSLQRTAATAPLKKSPPRSGDGDLSTDRMPEISLFLA